MATIEEQLQQYQDQLNQYQKPIAPPTGSPDDGSRRSWTGLLGGVLGGGQAPGYQLRGSEADTSGNRALLNFGIQTLLASGPAPVRPDLLSALATGLQGAQSSTDLDQRRGQAAALAQYNASREQRQDQLAALKEALPLLKLQQDAAALAKLKGDGSASTATAPGGGGAGTYEGSVLATEGTGRNPRSTAEGHGQFLEGTWREFVAANPTLFANMTPAQILAARNDPEMGARATTWLAQQNAPVLQAAGVTPSGVSLRVAHYLGATAAAKVMQAPDNAPVASFVSPEAVKANPELATMTAGQLRARYASTPNPAFLQPTQTAQGPATPATTGSPPAAPGAAPAPPGVQVGGVPPPPPGAAPGAPAGPGGMAAALPAPGSPTTVLRETQQRMPDGTVRTVVVPTPATATPPAPPVGGPATAEAAPFAPYQIAGAMQPPPASALPPRGGPPAQPPAEAGWGAGNRATGYGGGSPPPGVVAPGAAPVAPVAAPTAPSAAPAMATPPPFTMRPLTPTEAAATSGALPPDVEAEFKRDKAGAKTTEEWYAVNAKEQAARLAASTAANTERLRIEASERTAHNTRWEKQQEQEATARTAAEAARIKFENDKQLETLKSEQALKSHAAQKTMEPILAKAEAAQAMLKNAQNLELFARQQGDANALWSTDFGKRANNWIVTLGGNSEWAREAAARQSWDTLVNGMFNDVHVPGMGSQSNRETDMLLSQWGSASQTPLDRMTQLALIRKNAEARIADANDIHGLIENGKPASGIHDIRKNRQIFDRPPASTAPTTGDDWNGIGTYNAGHPMGEPYVTWAPKKGGGGVLKWARNTGDPNNPIQIMQNVDVSR